MVLNPSSGYSYSTNVYIPTFLGGQTAELIVSYARNPKKFAVNQLATITPVKTQGGAWLKLRPEALARLLTNLGESVWVDGQPRPMGPQNKQDFNAVYYEAQRYCETAPVGYMERDQAVWPIQDTQTQVLAHRAMTRRALGLYNVALNSANYLSSHVQSATNWSAIGGLTGGLWQNGTDSNPFIQNTLMAVAEQINLDTMAAVQPDQLTLVVSPRAARIMAQAQEIRTYLARSVSALPYLQSNIEGQRKNWLLPAELYGFTVVVDPTIQITSGRLVVPGAGQYVATNNSAIVLAQPGDLGTNIGQETSSFSSFHFFVWQEGEMIVETFDEPINAREIVSVTDTWDIKMVAPETCCLITNLFQ